MGEPAQGVQTRRERLAFLLTLAVVVVAAAFIGYMLGQFVFARWVGLPASPGDTRQARTVSPPDSVAVEEPAPAPAVLQPRAEAPPGGGGPPPAGAAGAAGGPSEPALSGVKPGPVVQLGVFSQRANAERTAAVARAEGYPVRIAEVMGSQGSVVYKVQVGPYPSREEAVAARERLRARWPDAFIP